MQPPLAKLLRQFTLLAAYQLRTARMRVSTALKPPHHRDVGKEEHFQPLVSKWAELQRSSRFRAWATAEEYRLARMLCAVFFTIAFGILAISSAFPKASRYDVQGPLRFTKEGTFQISIFEDLQCVYF